MLEIKKDWKSEKACGFIQCTDLPGKRHYTIL